MADFRIRGVRTALRTTTGTQDITVSDFGGFVPVGAIVRLVGATSPSNTATPGARFSMGFAAGSSQYVHAWNSQDGVASSNTHRTGNATELAVLIKQDGSGYDVRASLDSFITDGIRISVDVTDGVAYLIQVTLFGGPDAQAALEHITATAVAPDDTDWTTPGFEPTFCYVLGGLGFADAEGDAPRATWSGSFGFAGNNAGAVTQRGFSWSHTDNVATSASSIDVFEDLVAKTITGAAAPPFTQNHQVLVDSFLSNGIRFTNNSLANAQLTVFAVRLGDAKAAASTFTTHPTVGGARTITPGFNPGVALFLTTSSGIIGQRGSQEAASQGFGFSCPTEEFSVVWHEDDNAADMDNGVATSDYALQLLDEPGTTLSWSADATFDSTTVTITFGNTAAGGRQEFALVIERADFTLTDGGDSFPLAVGAGTAELTFSLSDGGDVVPVPDGSGTAELTFSLSGGDAVPSPTGSGTAELVFSSQSGGDAVPSPTGNGTAELTFSLLDGGDSVPPSTGSGTAELTFTGSGGDSVPPSTGSGTAELTFSLSGGDVISLPVGDGVAELAFVLSGLDAVPVPTGNGTASLTFVLQDGADSVSSPIGDGLAFVDVNVDFLECVEELLGGSDLVVPLLGGTNVVVNLLGSRDVVVELLGGQAYRVALLGGYDVIQPLKGSAC